jgi:biopolymer transport protein ExbD
VKLTRSEAINPLLFNAVPLVNVLFLLVLFFALSSTFVLQPGLAVSLPVSHFTLGPQRNAHIVTIKAGPLPALYFRNEKIQLDRLDELLRQAPAGNQTLIIRADRSVPYDQVMAVAARGLDRGFSIVLATAPQ